MTGRVRSVWVVTREYAGIAEAGGVKNVACSLAESLARRGVAITVILPRYGCVADEGSFLFSQTIRVFGEDHEVGYSNVLINNVNIVLLSTKIFRDKREVYVYSAQEEASVPEAVRGKGHHDGDCMNIVLQKGVLEYARHIGMAPDIIHCQDAHTACLPAMAKTLPQWESLFSSTSFVTTIHNAGPGYRQVIPGLHRAASLTDLSEHVLSKALLNGNVEPFLLSALYGKLSTVSPWYAKELLSPSHNALSEGLSGEFARRGISIEGIINGIDVHRYEPTDKTRSFLPYSFNPEIGDLAGKYSCRNAFVEMIRSFPTSEELAAFGTIQDDPHAVYFAYHGRVVWQKGIDTLVEAARAVLDQVESARFVVLGQGTAELEALLMEMARLYRGRFAFIRGYERALARLTVAQSDFLVLPSLFEPCGLEDYIGQIFGTIPIAHAVGGLQKIIHGKNGYLYRTDGHANSAAALAPVLIDHARRVSASSGRGCAQIDEYSEMIRFAARYVRTECNWDRIIEERYIPFYEDMLSIASRGE